MVKIKVEIRGIFSTLLISGKKKVKSAFEKEKKEKGND